MKTPDKRSYDGNDPAPVVAILAYPGTIVIPTASSGLFDFLRTIVKPQGLIFTTCRNDDQAAPSLQ